MSEAELVRDPGWAVGSNLTESICEPIVELYTDQTTPGFTSERSFLDAAPLARRAGSGV